MYKEDIEKLVLTYKTHYVITHGEYLGINKVDFTGYELCRK